MYIKYKNLIFWLATCVLMFCGSIWASEVENVKVFYDKENIVINDLQAEYEVEWLDVSLFSEASELLSFLVNKRINENDSFTGIDVSDRTEIENAYRMMFSEVLNGPEWMPIYKQYQQGAEISGEIVKYQITKVPAILINEKYLIYGVTSLSEALKIAEEKM